MKRLNIKYLLTLIFISIASIVFGQIADFPFSTNLNDIVNGHAAAAFGNPTLINDSGNIVLRLEGDEYLSFPNSLHQNIDINQNVEIQLRFKITDTYQDEPFSGTGTFGEGGKRVLFSNKENNIHDLGFDIYVEQMDEEYRILMSFGDDTQEGATFIFNDLVEENAWVDLRLILRINDEVPSIEYKLNGYLHHFPLNYLDVNLFKQSLNTQQFWLGTDSGNNQEYEYAYAETYIDYLKIFNPPFAGNSAMISSALARMTDHVSGTNTLTSNQQQIELSTILNNWDENTYGDISSEILNYISTYEQSEGTVFEFYGEYIDPKEVETPRALQFTLIQYFIDNLYTNSNVTAMSGIQFLDHQILPGAVDALAPRISATVAIDGDYNTNPGYFLNQQNFVIRPTGYYAAPGELVNITVPNELIDQGVYVQVGAHFVDIREDYRGFQRFPAMATKFEIENTTTTVANPLGGSIYLTFPDGSNFGSVNVQFDGAVKSPYFSTKTGFTNSLSTYQTDLNNAYVNWVDIESDNFMCTLPIASAEVSPDATKILEPLNEMIGLFNLLAGRPGTKIRSEYMVIEPQSYTQGTLPASYPMSIVNGDLTEAEVEAFPVSVTNKEIYMNTYDGTTVLHELGHLHSLPTMYEEGETNVNILTIMAFNKVFGVSLDEALYHTSGHQNLNGDQAALDWILDPKFRNNEEATYEEVSYQHRGVAKYVDVARLFSWDTLGLIHKHWYEASISSGEVVDGIEFVSPDEYIEVASNQLGFNFAPLWELWGSIPSEGMVNQLNSYEEEDRIRERILHYRSLVPTNAIEFQAVYNSIVPNIEDGRRARYDDMLAIYDEAVAESILNRIDGILCRYFNASCSIVPIDLINFEASKSNDYVQLDWSTASEVNNAYFDIERSIDGRNFTLIDNVRGANNSNTLRNYTVFDKTPFTGLNYYRLKQVDFDGRFDYSKTEEVDFENSLTFDIYPNPASDNIFIQSSEAYESIEILNVLGKLVYQREAAGSSVSLHSLPSGIYYIRILDSTKHQIAIQKIMVER